MMKQKLKNPLVEKYMKVRGQKLTPLQEEYLSGIGIRSPITKRDPRYHIAEELEKKGLLRLIDIKDSPFIGMVLTDAGKEYLTDRYETLDYIRQDNLIPGKYTISESDGTKGIRLTIVDKDSGAIIRETK